MDLYRKACRLGIAIFFLICIEQELCARLDERNLPAGAVIIQPGTGTITKAIQDLEKRRFEGKLYILLKKGEYYDNAHLKGFKNGIIIQGEGGSDNSYKDNKVTLISGIRGSADGAALHLEAPEAEVYSITFVNTVVGTQGVALAAQGDRQMYSQCSFKGLQDTLLTRDGRQFFDRCHIEGTVDFIWGTSRAWFNACSIEIRARRSAVQVITANGNGRNTQYESIFVFQNTIISDQAGVRLASTYLGRAWGPKPAVCFQNFTGPPSLNLDGWDMIGAGGREFDPKGFQEFPKVTKLGHLPPRAYTIDDVLGNDFFKKGTFGP